MPPNVQIVILKPSEPPGRGFILRLVETAAQRRTLVHVRFPLFPFARAGLCDLVENDAKELTLDGDGRGFKLTMRGVTPWATVRLLPVGQPPAAVSGLHAEASSDKSIHLSWPARTGSNELPRLRAARRRRVDLSGPLDRGDRPPRVRRRLAESGHDVLLPDYRPSLLATSKESRVSKWPVRTRAKNTSPPAARPRASRDRVWPAPRSPHLAIQQGKRRRRATRSTAPNNPTSSRTKRTAFTLSTSPSHTNRQLYVDNRRPAGHDLLLPRLGGRLGEATLPLVTGSRHRPL